MHHHGIITVGLPYPFHEKPQEEAVKASVITEIRLNDGFALIWATAAVSVLDMTKSYP